ncbi:hypothetical protein N7491_010441 [Penicillium cf. griseofulvum]|uniref:Uncharacterized protein n=1 Tax=Penicillium cf. griseofulvum TaxID=2972120 RepID=A0A9W9T5V2_9EURO|nr:hypothetical protein N7472_000773 [Penicillium cf. griseofulvum]KAJ5421996.1 hypothetical protein N7491_010441 [Penicillium cf. griseofulvum]
MLMRAFIPRRSLALPPSRLYLSMHPNPPDPTFQSRLLSKFPLPSTSRRSFQSSTTLRVKWTSSEAILYELKDRKIEKWGWVFYRTTYEDDEVWDSFKRILNFSVRSIISLDPRSELNEAMFDQLEFIFIEDKAKFDGASKEELRAHFQQWVANSFSAENPQADQRLLHDDEPVPRYRFFFEIDEDTLRSCGSESSGHASFVDGFWSSSEQSQNQVKATRDCEDVGWMRMDMAFFMDTHFYAGMSGSVEMWRFFYERPPAIVPNSKLIRLMQIQNMSRRR